MRQCLILRSSTALLAFPYKNDKKPLSHFFQGVSTLKVTNSDQPGRPTTVAAFLVLYGENGISDSDADTHKLRTGKGGDGGENPLLPLRP